MCGIAGYIGGQIFDAEKISSTLSLMHHRGPDGNGNCQLPLPDSDVNVLLLHSRLSILDLDPRSGQPFEVDRYRLIFNGEIYNYRELRQELKANGISFSTESDTEVLLKSYIHWGKECCKKFEGMWSFAIYDPRKKAVFLSRDRFGEKPLRYLVSSDGIYFGSEIKFIEALIEKPLEVNLNQIKRYLVNGFRSLYKSGETFFSSIRELPSGSSMFIPVNLDPDIERYWSPTIEFNSNWDRESAVLELQKRLRRSLELRLRSDVPIAFCLSGGVDSSSLVSLAAKEFGSTVHTFSLIDKDERYDERENINAVISDIGCDAELIHFSRDGFFERMRRLISSHDMPLGSISYYVHSFLSEAIAKAGYKVVLSGTGADELFTGYYDHFLLHMAVTSNLPDAQDWVSDWEKWIKPFVRNPYLSDPSRYVKNPGSREHLYLGREEFNQCLLQPIEEDFEEKEYCDELLRNRMANELFEEIIPVILNEDDLNSMMFSIENRSPFLDSALFEFAYSLPPELLIRDGYGKALLRDAMQGIVCDKVRLDREKKGFNASLNTLVDFDNQSTRETLLSNSPVFEIVRKDKIEQFFSANSLPNSISKFLFNFINVKLFLETRA